MLCVHFSHYKNLNFEEPQSAGPSQGLKIRGGLQQWVGIMCPPWSRQGELICQKQGGQKPPQPPPHACDGPVQGCRRQGIYQPNLRGTKGIQNHIPNCCSQISYLLVAHPYVNCFLRPCCEWNSYLERSWFFRVKKKFKIF